MTIDSLIANLTAIKAEYGNLEIGPFSFNKWGESNDFGGFKPEQKRCYGDEMHVYPSHSGFTPSPKDEE